MQTFLPSPDYKQSAKWLDTVRLNSQANECLTLVRSLMHVYAKRKDGSHGFENHTVAKLWKGHELQLSRYALAVVEEWVARPVKAPNWIARKERVALWRGLVDEFEDTGAPNTVPSLVGDENFHSAFRALLLHKEQQLLTFRAWQKSEYPAITIDFPKQKRAWKPEFYELIWKRYGRPDPVWYGQWGWDEVPTDKRIFYTEDRIPQAAKEAERKQNVPNSRAYVRKRKT